MSNLRKLNRRQFMFTSSAAALSAAVEVTATPKEPQITEKKAAGNAASASPPYTPAELLKFGPQRTFSGNHTLQVAMPMGGIGTGCICLNGYGGMQDFSIRNRPSTTAIDAHFAPSEAAFALLYIRGTNSIARMVEGQLPPEKIFDQGLQGQCYRCGGHEGQIGI